MGKEINVTENYLKIEPQIVIGNVILMSIVDYDYVLKEFVAKPYTGSLNPNPRKVLYFKPFSTLIP